MRSANRAAAGAVAWQVINDANRPGKPTVWARFKAAPAWWARGCAGATAI